MLSSNIGRYTDIQCPKEQLKPLDNDFYVEKEDISHVFDHKIRR